jgi:hypothetical protein
MNAYIIMHNMIIEDERGKDLDSTHYKLMGCPVRVHRREHRVARFIHSYHVIRDNEVHAIFKMISLESGGDGMSNKTWRKHLRFVC